MTYFASYWSAYADEAEATAQQKATWSSATLARGIVRKALTGLAASLAADGAPAKQLVDFAPGLVGLAEYFEYHHHRFVLFAVEDPLQAPALSTCSLILEQSREAIGLCVVPTIDYALASHIDERFPGRSAAVITLFPVDLDALASGTAELLDLIQFKLYRHLALDTPAIGTQFDARLFNDFVGSHRSTPNRLEDVSGILNSTGDDERWVEHPLVDRVRGTLERGRACLLAGPSSSGKSVLALQVGRSLVLAGKKVGYINLGLADYHPAYLFSTIACNVENYAVIVVDDLQSNPALARFILATSSAWRRSSLRTLPPLLAVSWVDYAADALTWFEDCLPISVRSVQVRQKLAARYRDLLPAEAIDDLVRACGDDLFLLRLSLDGSEDLGVEIDLGRLAEHVWHSRVTGSAVDENEARRIGLVAASLGRLDIAAPPGFLRHEARTTDAGLNGLQRSGLLRRHQANFSVGHRSLCALLADWLARNGEWRMLHDVGGPQGTGPLVLDYLRSLGSSLAVDSLRALHARAGFKDQPMLNRRAAVIVELWDAFNSVLERIEHQQAMDPSWGNVPSSAMFAVVAFSEVGSTALASGSLEFLRRHWHIEAGRLEVSTASLATVDDFEQIRRTMREEDDATATAGLLIEQPVDAIDIDRFHRTWMSGLVLCAEGAAQSPIVPLASLASHLEQAHLPSGAFYPERVPWCTARVLLGLAACGRTVDTSRVVARAVKWLLLDRADGGASDGGVWHSGTGSWNTTIETTGMVVLALAAVGYDCSSDQLNPARAYLLSCRNQWTSPGNELAGALAIQAFLDIGGAWEDVASETRALSRWAKGEAFWQSAVSSASESFRQSCNVAQIASHLISIGWTAIRTDLPAFLDALGAPDLLRTEPGGASEAGATVGLKAEPEPIGLPGSTSEAEQQLDVVRRLDRLSLSSCTVVGEYRRYNERIRNELRDWCNRIRTALTKPTVAHENFLIWAAPGSGKSFLVQQLADELKDQVRYVELNLARLAREDFSRGLASVRDSEIPVLCLLDEIDARGDQEWPYEVCFSDLDLNLQDSRVAVFVLIGSSLSGLQSMTAAMRQRSKGEDLVDRVPSSNRFEIPSPSLEDKMIVVASQVVSAAQTRGTRVREIERLAMYCILRNDDLRTPRQLRDLAVSAVERMSGDDDRLAYDDLFSRGDHRDKHFWAANQEAAAELSGTFIRIEP